MNKLTYIDDCQLDHFILKKILSRYGLPFEVKCTNSGKGVLDSLTQYADTDTLPDIIFLDIYTPGLDAWEFLDDMQALYPLLAKPVEVYILSASKYPADVERLKQYHFVKAFIMKPITKEVLQELIKQKESPANRFTTIEMVN